MLQALHGFAVSCCLPIPLNSVEKKHLEASRGLKAWEDMAQLLTLPSWKRLLDLQTQVGATKANCKL